jgi:hypothetical protein
LGEGAGVGDGVAATAAGTAVGEGAAPQPTVRRTRRALTLEAVAFAVLQEDRGLVRGRPTFIKLPHARRILGREEAQGNGLR